METTTERAHKQSWVDIVWKYAMPRSTGKNGQKRNVSSNFDSVRPCRLITAIFAIAFSGAVMADTVTADPPTGDHVSVVPAASATAEIAALHDEVSQFLRGKYVIQSGSFYRFRSDVPWVAISRRVQNQMAEKSIRRMIYDWNSPGRDFVDVYPQDDTAFAVAMQAKGAMAQGSLVGYFVLVPRATPQELVGKMSGCGDERFHQQAGQPGASLFDPV